jgi:beta-lactamase regulating signal transducer with metallopeptidase domain
MEALLVFASTSATHIAGALFSAVWEGSLLAACVLLCLTMLPRLSSAARSVLWINVFSLLVLLQFLPLIGVNSGLVMDAHHSALRLDARWALAIVAIWVGLSLLRGTQLVWGAVHLARMAKRATVVAADPELQKVLQTRSFTGKIRTAELCVSPEAERPSVFGFFRPRILFPSDLFNRLSAPQLRQIVIHEMEHLRRADDWTNLFQKLAIALFPLNPALLWVDHRLCSERELACDDSVLESSCGRKAYAICLTRLAEHSMLRRSLSLALGAWERQSELVRRVHRILRLPGQAMSRRQTFALTGSLSLFVLISALGLSRSPEIVQFSDQAQTATGAIATQAELPEYANFAVQDRVRLNSSFAKAQMAKAIMPSAQDSRALTPTFAAGAQAVQKNAVLRKPLKRRQPETQQAWVVMTGWSDADGVPQFVLTTARTTESSIGGKANHARASRVSYAAVRVPYGWLIVQI